MVEENENSGTCLTNNSDVVSLDEDDEVKLGSPSLRNHKNKDKFFNVMHIKYFLEYSLEPKLIN
jgi:beta-mannanase